MKKLLSIVMLICITASSLTSVYAVNYGEELQNAPIKSYEQKFSDVPESYWAFESIKEMAKRGVFSGYPDGTFHPDSSVTRAEVAQVLAKIDGTLYKGWSASSEDIKESDWYASAVGATERFFNKYRESRKDGKITHYYDCFHPNDAAEREDVIVALMKQYYGSIYNVDEKLCDSYVDSFMISEEKRKYVSKAIEDGTISGYLDEGGVKFIYPHEAVSRAELATMLYRLYGCPDVSDVMLDTSNYTIHCTMDEFLARYNENLDNNYYRIEEKDSSNAVGAKRYKLDGAMFQTMTFGETKEFDYLQRQTKKTSQDVDYIKNWKAYIYTKSNGAGETNIICDSNNVIKSIVINMSEVRDENLKIEKERNKLSVLKYRSICAIMALYNISFDDGAKMLSGLLFNDTYRSEGAFNLEISKSEFSGFHEDLLQNTFVNGLIPYEDDNTEAMDCNIYEFVDRYNANVYKNYKYITDDIRYSTPEDYIMNKESLWGVRSPSLSFGIKTTEVNTYLFGATASPYNIYCNKQNKIMFIDVNSNENNYYSQQLVTKNNFPAICMIAAVENIEFEEAKGYYFTTIADKTFTSDKVVYEKSSSPNKITIIAKKLFLDTMSQN